MTARRKWVQEGARPRAWSSWPWSRPGGTATTTSSPTASPRSSRGGSTGGPGRSPGRCAGSSATTTSRPIVALAHPPDHALPRQEQALAEELGVRWVHVPIVDLRGINDRRAISDQLEAAAAVVADPKNQPVYFHCHHGINRASMVQMAYRMLYCGWTLEQASDEIDRDFGLVEASRGPDYRHMEEFYRDRVLPRRLVVEPKDTVVR